MPTYKVAQIHKEGRDLLVIPLEPSFDHKTHAEKQEFTAHMQECAQSAGMKGRIVPVWDGEDDQLNFFAPPYLNSLVTSITVGSVKKSLNAELIDPDNGE